MHRILFFKQFLSQFGEKLSLLGRQYAPTLLLTLSVFTIYQCSGENPFLPKISQRALPPAREGFFELRYLGNRTTVLATLSRSDLQKLVPQEEYGGDLSGDFGDDNTPGTGTFMNANFVFTELGGNADGNCQAGEPCVTYGSDDDGVCETGEQCVLAPAEDSIYLMNFDITAKDGLLDSSLNTIKNKYGATPCPNTANCTSEQKMGAMLNMSPANLPIVNIPYLGTIYTIALSIVDGFDSVINFFADLFGLNHVDLSAGLDNVIRNGIKDTYGLSSVNDKIVSAPFVKEAVVRHVMYIPNSEDAKKTLVLCEENSANSNGTDLKCTNPGGLRKGVAGNQELPKDPPEQLGDGNNGYRDPTLYVGTRLAMPIFMGDALADMNTLFIGNYKNYLNFKKGTEPPVKYREDGTSYYGRYSYLESVLANGKLVNREGKEIKTEIMYSEKSPYPNPGVGEFFQRLPVTINGTAYDGYDLSKASYAGADSLTEDAILIWISDRGAYFGGCLPNANNVYWNRCRDGLAESEKPWLRPATGLDTDFFGAGMYMGNMNPTPKLTMDFYMSADNVRNTITAAVDYQYKYKEMDLVFFTIKINELTSSLVQYFYDTDADLVFSLDNINVGITREQMAAATKQSFNGYLDNNTAAPIVDPGDFQAVNPNGNYYCDPLKSGFPQTCTSFRPPTSQLTQDERIFKARAQKPLRRISDILFDNSKGEPNFYLSQLSLRLLARCAYDTSKAYHSAGAPFSLNSNFVYPRQVPVLFYKDQGGAGVKAGFYLDDKLTRSVCEDGGNCVSAEMVPGGPLNCQVPNPATSNTTLTNEASNGLVAQYSGYLNSNKYMVLNNFSKKVYMQSEAGLVYEMTFEESTDSDKIRASWKVLDTAEAVP